MEIGENLHLKILFGVTRGNYLSITTWSMNSTEVKLTEEGIPLWGMITDRKKQLDLFIGK